MKRETTSPPADNPDGVRIVELLQRRRLSDNAFEIELTRPPSFEFEAGQNIRFIHDSVERYYALISGPEDPTLALCVYHLPQGRFSPVLAAAEPGATFRITGPHGYFTFRPSERKPVFVASGTGVAPFVSMGRSGVADFEILHEVEAAEDFFYRELFQQIASSYIPCIPESPAGKDSAADAFCGSAADYVKNNLPPAAYDFYLCGERNMTRAVTLLVDDQFPGSYVFKEVFF